MPILQSIDFEPAQFEGLPSPRPTERLAGYTLKQRTAQRGEGEPIKYIEAPHLEVLENCFGKRSDLREQVHQVFINAVSGRVTLLMQNYQQIQLVPAKGGYLNAIEYLNEDINRRDIAVGVRLFEHAGLSLDPEGIEVKGSTLFKLTAAKLWKAETSGGGGEPSLELSREPGRERTLERSRLSEDQADLDRKREREREAAEQQRQDAERLRQEQAITLQETLEMDRRHGEDRRFIASRRTLGEVLEVERVITRVLEREAVEKAKHERMREAERTLERERGPDRDRGMSMGR